MSSAPFSLALGLTFLVFHYLSATLKYLSSSLDLTLTFSHFCLGFWSTYFLLRGAGQLDAVETEELGHESVLEGPDVVVVGRKHFQKNLVTEEKMG